MSAPLGVSRLVGVLDDARDAVRNAGLLLLVDLTAGASDELRKIVAFEDVFGKVFALIRLEGGLGDAGITAQDCLSLLANLIRNSASNQTMFRESGCVAQLKQLLEQIFPSEDDALFVTQSREKGGWGVLQLLGLFLVEGENFTAQNQTAFFRAGTAQTLIDLGFAVNIASPLRAAALKDAALLIQANAPLQESFASMTVHVSIEDAASSLPNGNRSRISSRRGDPKSNAKSSARPSAEKQPTYIIEALLELTLSNTRQDQASRAAGCSLIQAYLTKHDRIRAHFLQRAIAGHTEHEEAANALNTLLQPTTTDPLGVTFASWILQDLIVDNTETKDTLSQVKEGDEDAGEDVLTAIQTLGSHLQTALQQAAEERFIVAQASLLIALLWQFSEGINNLLAEGSSLVQTLVEHAKATTTSSAVSGMSAALLGVLYEFSTKDSPIPRRTLAPLLTQKLGRSNYLTALLSLRQHPAVRDFGLDDISDPTALILPAAFVDLYLAEYVRLRKAIDKDPGLEVLPLSAAEEGIDRDILDTLRQEAETTRTALATAQQDALVLGQQHETEKLTAAKELQTANAEVERLRRVNNAMQTSHEEETTKTSSQHKQALEQLQRTSEQRAQNAAGEAQRALAVAKRENESAVQNAKTEVQKQWASKVQELEKKVAESGNALRSEQEQHASVTKALEALRKEHNQLANKSKEAGRQVESLTTRLMELGKAHQVLQSQAEKDADRVKNLTAQLELGEKELASARSQAEEAAQDLQARNAELASERSGFNDLEKEFETFKKQAESEKEEFRAEREKLTEEAKKKEGKGQDAETVKLFKGKVEELGKEVKTLKSELDSVKRELETARKEVEKAGKDLEAARKEGETAKKDFETAKRGLDSAKEGEREAKEELESMLLVMGDLEAERDGYRRRVREIGGLVSEESESEEDGDEESEEGEENRTDVTVD